MPHKNSEQDNLAASGYVRADYLNFKFTRLTYDQHEQIRAHIDSQIEEKLINIDGPPGDCVFLLRDNVQQTHQKRGLLQGA